MANVIPPYLCSIIHLQITFGSCLAWHPLVLFVYVGQSWEWQWQQRPVVVVPRPPMRVLFHCHCHHHQNSVWTNNVRLRWLLSIQSGSTGYRWTLFAETPSFSAEFLDVDLLMYKMQCCWNVSLENHRQFERERFASYLPSDVYPARDLVSLVLWLFKNEQWWWVSWW